MLMFGTICGILSTKRILQFFFVSFFLFACVNKQDKQIEMIYALKGITSNDILKRDTLIYNYIGIKHYKVEYNSDDTIFYVKEDSCIYLCDKDFKQCNITHNLIDTLRVINLTATNIFLPYFANDTRYIGNKEYIVNNRAYNLYKFKEDELLHSNSIKYSYYLKDIGFVCYIDYYERKYKYLEQIKSNYLPNTNIEDIKLLISFLVNDSTFFEPLKTIIPPPVPQWAK